MSNCNPITVCVLDDGSSTARTMSGLLESAGCEVRPFTQPDTFLSYARDHHPQAAIVDFGGSHAKGFEVRARLREISPMTSVIVSLKVHQGQARTVRPGKDLTKMIRQVCAGKIGAQL